VLLLLSLLDLFCRGNCGRARTPSDVDGWGPDDAFALHARLGFLGMVGQLLFCLWDSPKVTPLRADYLEY
jgi:hypothetical protein